MHVCPHCLALCTCAKINSQAAYKFILACPFLSFCCIRTACVRVCVCFLLPLQLFFACTWHANIYAQLFQALLIALAALEVATKPLADTFLERSCVLVDFEAGISVDLNLWYFLVKLIDHWHFWKLLIVRWYISSFFFYLPLDFFSQPIL